MGWWRYYTPKPAREVKGGIKAQSRRGAFANSWWGQRWIGVLESFDIGARLNRGRTYARKGQVLDIEIEKGAVRAAVQGSRSRPYEVESASGPCPVPNGARSPGPGGRFISLAKLLAGEMPEEIEEVFERQVVPLPPPSAGPGDRLLLPRLVQPLQAHGRGLLPPGRGIRPGPLSPL